eukprot:2586594-Heterocapsa_arctica.AAC.1
MSAVALVPVVNDVAVPCWTSRGPRAALLVLGELGDPLLPCGPGVAVPAAPIPGAGGRAGDMLVRFLLRSRLPLDW